MTGGSPRSDERPARHAEAVAEEDFSPPLASSYLVGVYLAVNAVPDVYLLVDGPDCAYTKAQFIQGTHDLRSNLTTVSGFHRVANTGAHPAEMAGDRGGIVEELLGRMARHPPVRFLLVTAMPMAAITEVDYARLARRTVEETGVPTALVPPLSLRHDWLEGYAQALAALARGLPLAPAARRADAVAVVGHLHHRNEADGEANVAELGSLARAAGTDLVCVWPSGSSTTELARVAEADTIVSLPYGREAARVLAARTGARLLDLEVPFGWDATERWLTTLAGLTGSEHRAARHVEAQARIVATRLEWLVPNLFQGRSVAYIGDPHLLAGVRSALELFGMKLAIAALTGRPVHGFPEADRHFAERIVPCPRQRSLRERLEHLSTREALDVAVTTSQGIEALPAGVPWTELGFPSYFTHALVERPFLGFRGLLALAEALSTALRRGEVERARAPAGGREGTLAGTRVKPMSAAGR